MSRILVVDDDFDTCEVIRLALEYDNFEVLCLANAETIYNCINSFKPDVVIIDYRLRGSQNGGEVCKQIKENPETNMLPVILMTAYLLKSDPMKDFGCDAFISKPFDLSDITTQVNKCLKIR